MEHEGLVYTEDAASIFDALFSWVDQDRDSNGNNVYLSSLG